MELFAMGAYGPFVWSSYLLTVIVVVVSTIQGKLRHKRVAESITQRLKIEETGE